MRPRLHVPAIGGPHQFAHFLPIAFELERRGSVDVTIFVPTAEDQHEAQILAEELGMPFPRTVVMDLPRALVRIVPGKKEKLARLLSWFRALRACDAILCAERTSTILKRLPGHCPHLFHIPHGAGDRAVGFEKRFRLFDAVLVAGDKDRDRLIAEGLTNKDSCHVAGPIKVAAVLKGHKSRPALFDNQRPVILYNPHFSRALSSADAFVHRLAEAVAADGRYNLVIAPHVRLAKSWSAQQRDEWEALAVTDQILVDLGSRRSVDMTYTLGSDLYVGDVSSQVYEFMVQPRPCVFVNAHGAEWENSQDYAMWRFGEVITPDGDIPGAIDRAFAQHEHFFPSQAARAKAALDGLGWTPSGEPTFGGQDPIVRGADLVEAAMGCRADGLDDAVTAQAA